MELWQADEGDVITIPTHYPATVIVTSAEWVDEDGGFTNLGWSAPGAAGRTFLSSLTVIERAGAGG